MKTHYRAAISGLGNIAWLFDRKNPKKKDFSTHAFSYAANPQTTVSGGYSPDRIGRETFEAQLRIPAYETFETLLAETTPDIVSICSPSEFHTEQVIQCIESETAMIWLEKPPADSLDGLDGMLARQAAKGGKSKILVNYQRRYSKQYQKLKDIYEKNTLGPCRLFQINYSRGLEINGSHMLDILFFITGDKKNWNIEWVSGDNDNPSFSMSLENGEMVMVAGTDLPYHNIDISMTCENGRASVIHGGVNTVIEERVEHELFPGFYRLREKSAVSRSAIKDEMESALSDLISAHENNREPLSNLASARNTMNLIEKVRLMQRSRKS